MKVHGQLSILDDTIQDIYQAMFYEATGGKIHQFGTDMPIPAAINPLTREEFNEWQTRPMKITKVRVARVARRRGKKDVTVAEDIPIRSSANEFYGYRSEAPMSRMFKEAEPVGTIASAVKAAGELSAMALKNSEDDSKIWEALAGSFGVDISKVKDYVVPDTTNSSVKDMIKFSRKSTHMLYGFNSRAPSVTVEGGSYRPETIAEVKLIDYHKLYIGLRFIGEYASRYGKYLKKPGDEVYFAPVLREAESFKPAKFAETITIPKKFEANPIISRAAENTMKYYLASIDTYGVAAMLKQADSRILVCADGDITADVIRIISKQRTDLAVHIDPTKIKYREVKEYSDIGNDRKMSFNDRIMAGIDKTKLMYDAGYKSVMSMAFEVMFTGSTFTKMAAKLIPIMRKRGELEIRTAKEIETLKKIIAANIPKDMGFLLFMLLNQLSVNKQAAQAKFLELLMHIKSDDKLVITGNYSEAFIDAVANTKDLSHVISAIQSGYNRANSFVHATKHFTFRNLPGSSISKLYEDAIEKYVERKSAFWRTHYLSRVEECRIQMDKIRPLIASRKNIKRKKTRSLTELIATKISTMKFAEKMDKELVELEDKLDRYKKNSITYMFLAEAYTHLTYKITDTLKVHVSVKAEDAKVIILKSAENYVKKRMKWNKARDELEKAWKTAKAKIEISSRITDMCNLADNALSPKVTWAILFSISEAKFRVTERSLTKCLREFSTHFKTVETDQDESEDVVMEDFGIYVEKVDWEEKPLDEVYEEDPSEDSSDNESYFSAEEEEGTKTDVKKKIDDIVVSKESMEDSNLPDDGEDSVSVESVVEEMVCAKVDEVKVAAKPVKSSAPPKDLMAMMGMMGMTFEKESEKATKLANDGSKIDFMDYYKTIYFSGAKLDVIEKLADKLGITSAEMKGDVPKLEEWLKMYNEINLKLTEEAFKSAVTGQVDASTEEIDDLANIGDIN